jgi:hypothetical protein
MARKTVPTAAPVAQPTEAPKPLVVAGNVIGQSAGVTAASGSKSQRTTIRHESNHMHAQATKLPKK